MKYLFMGFAIFAFTAAFFVHNKIEESTCIIVGYICFATSTIIDKIEKSTK